MPGDRPYWVALNHVRGIGAARVRRLKESFATLHDAWHAPRHELLAAGLDDARNPFAKNDNDWIPRPCWPRSRHAGSKF